MTFVEWLLAVVAGLTGTVIGVLLARNEKHGELIGQIRALERENTELREKLKKEAEDFKHLLNHLRSYYENRAEREEKKVPKSDALPAHDFDKRIMIWFEDERKKSGTPSDWMKQYIDSLD